MAEEKKKNTKKSSGKSDKAVSAKKKSSVGQVKSKKTALGEEELLAITQRRSLIMFISAVILTAIIFIPGDLLWLWAHNAVRGIFSLFALFWPALLLFLAVAAMLDKAIPKLWVRTGFAVGLVSALNAFVYIFTFEDEYNIKQSFTDGIVYKGGGVWGFIFGAPFVRLFGVVPARILIVLVILILTVFALDIPVKRIYTYLLEHILDWFKSVLRDIKRKHAKRHPVKIADDAYFDDDYNAYDANDEEEIDDDDIEASDDEHDDFDNEPSDDDTLDSQQSDSHDKDNDLDSVHEIFDDAEDTFDEDNDDYSIDIDIDTPVPQNGSDSVDNYSDSELTADVFGDVIFDEEKPKASEIARNISLKKQTPSKTSPEQKQFDPQTIPIEDELSRKLRMPEKTQAAPQKPKYVYPPVALLTRGKKGRVNYEAELKDNARKLIDTLDSFSVGAKIVGYCRGPSITRYEIKPAPGVKIAKITSLSDDIALGLAADGVRIEAPIPGKPAIGIEVPNRLITPVTMRELIDSEEFRQQKSKLGCVLGRDVSDQIVVMDLASMPHLLIAGTTGSGKSVCVNSILMSILFKASPDEVKLIMIDPKQVEFSKYKGIPHLLVPVVTDAKKAAGALNWAVKEMEERYREFSMYNVKDVDSYNAMVDKNLAEMTDDEFEDDFEEYDEQEKGEVVDGEFIPPKAKKHMPKIVIAIDELADLMMVAPGEVEDSICRLAQKARAAGMHLVIATQRPSVNVITGVIKANIPSRISLKVAAVVDSKTILDMGGGEKLIGRGDMLFNPVGAPKPMRVQGGYSSDEDIEAVTSFIKKHASSDYDDDISQEMERLAQESINAKNTGKGDFDDDDLSDSDPMLDQAIDIVVNAGQASTSLLQRKLKVGYARAGRIVDTMEQMGIVGPHEGSKSRKVLLTPEQNIERKLSK